MKKPFASSSPALAAKSNNFCTNLLSLKKVVFLIFFQFFKKLICSKNFPPQSEDCFQSKKQVVVSYPV